MDMKNPRPSAVHRGHPTPLKAMFIEQDQYLQLFLKKDCFHQRLCCHENCEAFSTRTK